MGWSGWSALLLLAALSAPAQTPPEPLSIASRELPKAYLRQGYSSELRAQGGGRPLEWQIVSGALPPGIILDAHSGRISGAATDVGEFQFTVRVTDAEHPPGYVQRTFVLRVVAPLTVQWKDSPRVEGDHAIRGSALVTNGTDQGFNLTFIVVAVNETGKAFALGYQNFALAPESSSPVLEFGTTLPAGQYIVHLDVVAEDPGQNSIYRARLQTSSPLGLTGLP